MAATSTTNPNEFAFRERFGRKRERNEIAVIINVISDELKQNGIIERQQIV